MEKERLASILVSEFEWIHAWDLHSYVWVPKSQNEKVEFLDSLSGLITRKGNKFAWECRFEGLKGIKNTQHDNINRSGESRSAKQAVTAWHKAAREIIDELHTDICTSVTTCKELNQQWKTLKA